MARPVSPDEVVSGDDRGTAAKLIVPECCTGIDLGGAPGWAEGRAKDNDQHDGEDDGIS